MLGKSYPDKGLETGEALIHDLARHPATARHIARKLAAHFVSSVPPKALVASLERAFRDTGGDLAALARTLVTHEAAWSEPPRKLLPPYDFLIAIARGFELEVPARRLLRLSASLGQPLWNPPSPKGWPDDDDAWLAASAIRERLRVAGEAAAKAAAKRDPVARAGELFASALDPRVLEAVRRAESRQQGMELLIMSPAFQRR